MTTGEYIRHTKFGNPEFDVEPVTVDESRFRHSGWAARRGQIWNALRRCQKSDARLSRFANCGSGAWLQKSADGSDLRIVSNHCNDRWCVPCQTARCAKMREVLARLLDGQTVRFITLTLRHSQTPLTDQLDRLYRSFSTLRRRRFWRDTVNGGAAFAELKLGEKDGLWHCHLHVLCTGKFMPQRDLSREWHAVTGDSSIVDIRAVSDAGHAAAYVTKYVTKPADASVYANETALDELICSLGGRRLCLTFGAWRGEELEADPPSDVQWISVGRIDDLRARAAEGDVEAQRWIGAAARKYPLFAQFLTSAGSPGP